MGDDPAQFAAAAEMLTADDGAGVGSLSAEVRSRLLMAKFYLTCREPEHPAG